MRQKHYNNHLIRGIRKHVVLSMMISPHQQNEKGMPYLKLTSVQRRNHLKRWVCWVFSKMGWIKDRVPLSLGVIFIAW